MYISVYFYLFFLYNAIIAIIVYTFVIIRTQIFAENTITKIQSIQVLKYLTLKRSTNYYNNLITSLLNQILH